MSGAPSPPSTPRRNGRGRRWWRAYPKLHNDPPSTLKNHCGNLRTLSLPGRLFAAQRSHGRRVGRSSRCRANRGQQPSSEARHTWCRGGNLYVERKLVTDYERPSLRSGGCHRCPLCPPPAGAWHGPACAAAYDRPGHSWGETRRLPMAPGKPSRDVPGKLSALRPACVVRGAPGARCVWCADLAQVRGLPRPMRPASSRPCVRQAQRHAPGRP
jgi:hypothetical protein